MKIAVTGAGGQLGSELCRQLGESAVALTRQALDVTDRRCILDTLDSIRPDAVINAAAYTAVDQAESEPALCREVNAEGVAHVVEACRRLHCPLVQVSTDYVFGRDAGRRVPYRETDAPGPLNFYGQTKLEGERHAQCWPKHFIVRTCGLYTRPLPGDGHHNFVRIMLQLASRQQEIRVVDDQHCTPTFTADLAQAIRHLLTTTRYGTYHVTNDGSTTWYNLAAEIFRLARLTVSLQPISTSQYRTTARRPTYSVLDTAKYHHLNAPPLPSWQQALATCLANLDLSTLIAESP